MAPTNTSLCYLSTDVLFISVLCMSHNGGYCHSTVVYALNECSIRHTDTAKKYGCEPQLRSSLTESGVERESLRLTTKLWPGDYGYESTSENNDSFKISLVPLLLSGYSGYPLLCDSLSLWQHFFQNVHCLIILLSPGVCHSIGVRNFLASHLEKLKEDRNVISHINWQVEYHPFQGSQELEDYCQSAGIVFAGYCPPAKCQASSHPHILQLAEKYGCSAAQICISWSLQIGAASPSLTVRSTPNWNQSTSLSQNHISWVQW
uniref:Zgc:110366 n=1 Tax=Callorhinchus milii TaxID=7868 RepID=A0A4W3IDZ7_CALMI